MATLLEVEGLTTRLHLPGRTVYAVEEVSFTIAQGETVGLVGESGCGKTMTGASIARLLPEGGRIESGRVLLDGRNLTALTEGEMRRVRGRELGVVFQDPMTSLNPTMRVGDQIGEPLLIHRMADKASARSRALELLDLVGVPAPSERIDSYPHQLSGGLRQRVCIAIALACEPKVLIADEPTTSLDVSIQDQILVLLERLKADLRIGILLITHDMGVIAGHADRVLVMYAGRVVEEASTRQLFRHPRHRYSEALLESVPKLDQDSESRLYSIPGHPPELTSAIGNCSFAPRCRYATERCRGEMPTQLPSSEGGSYSCFHPRTEPLDRPETDPLPARPLRGIEHDVLVRVSDVVKEFETGRHGLARRGRGTVKAVSGVSLDVIRGETLGVVGESGCGKTTLARMLVGLETPDSGSIAMKGLDGRRRSRFRQRQMIFQDPYSSLDPRMRVRAILAEPMVVQRMYDRAGRETRILELLSEVGLAESAVRLFPREFSGGQRQRLGFARALALRPRMIVADEPVSALDVSIRAQLLNLMRRLQDEHDLTCVVISHDLSVIRYIADRVAVMYLGKLVEIGPTASVYERPAHPYSAGLLDAVPIPDPDEAARHERASVFGEPPSSVNPPSGCRFRTRCPRAREICSEVEPQMRLYDTSGHSAACHFPLWEPGVIPAGSA